jgi:catechol 2,3-dioxygenase-like lactoylglutathione lyase family enzyme
MIDHTGTNVKDLEESKRFYAAALAPLGYELLLEFHGSVAGFGEQGKPDFWIAQGEPNTPQLQVAFRADTRRVVDAFYEAALGVGGRDNGTPGLRPQYHPDYYRGAFVLDPDDHNIETVLHSPA